MKVNCLVPNISFETRVRIPGDWQNQNHDCDPDFGVYEKPVFFTWKFA